MCKPLSDSDYHQCRPAGILVKTKTASRRGRAKESFESTLMSTVSQRGKAKSVSMAKAKQIEFLSKSMENANNLTFSEIQVKNELKKLKS